MGLQKYRADVLDETDANGAQLWVARFWHLYSKVVNCPTPFGPRTVYVQGPADTFFSIPAACVVKRETVRGFLTREDGCWRFNPYTKQKED